MSTITTKPVRSFLFVPALKASMIEKGAGAGADAVILDLEDSVPTAAKTDARNLVTTKLPWLAKQGQRVYVRINRSPYLYDFDDMIAVVGENVEGLILSKPCGPEDVDCVTMMLSEVEHRKGVEIGTTRLVPTLETARSMETAYEIAKRDRVSALAGPMAKNGDSARALGVGWSEHGRESLYLKSRVVMAARAAGKAPIGGLWQQVHDLDGLEIYLARERELGLVGQMLLHPSNVAPANRAFSPTSEDIAYYQGMIDAHAEAVAAGRAACIYDGEHIDIAHVQTAREIAAQAAAFED
ncbi:MAG: HpcH/HpaI aldolase/citrate lyase family protein [Alphaproteobacteria bacterium]